MNARFIASRYCPSFIRPAFNRIESSPLGVRMARGAFWSIAGAVVNRGLMLLAGIFAARWLGKEIFGEWGIINNTVGMFGMFAGFGLGLTATKYVAEFRDSDPLKAGRILTMCAIVYWITGAAAAVALFFSAPWLAENTLAAPHLAGGLRIGSLLLLLGAVNGGQLGALAGFEAFKRLAKVSALTGIVHFPCVIGGCWWLGLEGALWGGAVSCAFGVVITRLAIIAEAGRFRVPLWTRQWTRELAVLWKFSLPTLAAGLLVIPAVWFCQTLLARQPDGYAGLAEYTVGATWRGLVQYLTGLLCAAYLPVAASIDKAGARQQRKLMWTTALGSVGLTLLTALALFAASPWILQSYGAGFSTGIWVFGLLLLTGVVDSANGIFMQTLLASGRAYLRLISNFAWCMSMVGFSFWLIPEYGALGLAAAICIAQALHLCFQIPLAVFFCGNNDQKTEPAA